MPLISLKIPAGIYTEDSSHAARERWVDSDNVRFFKRFAEKIGGYERLSDEELGEAARGSCVWRALDGVSYLAFGTRSKLWLYRDDDTLYNITPIRASGTLTNPFTTTNGSPLVVVADTAHGANDGDTVIFDGASAVGGLTIDGEYVIDLINANSYRITAASNASSGATGGGTVAYEYEINQGPDENAASSDPVGYGDGGYSDGVWSGAILTLSGVVVYRIWALVNWGEDLIATYYTGAMYQWDKTNGEASQATAIANSPDVNNSVFVFPDIRYLVSLGAYDETATAQDPMLIRWASQETLTDWTPSATNTAGDLRLESGNTILASVSTRFGRLILTDFSAYLMTQAGSEFVFGVKLVGENCGVIAPHAVVGYNGLAYWMGRDRFFGFDGTVRELPCDLQDDIFTALNYRESFKVAAGPNVSFHEIFWSYPTGDSRDNDKTVILNVEEAVWYPSSIARTTWLDRNVLINNPVAVDGDGVIYRHEAGVNAGDEPLPYHLQSGDMMLSEGDQFMHIRRMLVDFDRISGDHELQLVSKKYPREAGYESGPYSFSEATEQISVRARGRSVAMRVSSSALDNDFRMGEWRADATEHGRR